MGELIGVEGQAQPRLPASGTDSSARLYEEFRREHASRDRAPSTPLETTNRGFSDMRLPTGFANEQRLLADLRPAVLAPAEAPQRVEQARPQAPERQSNRQRSEARREPREFSQPESGRVEYRVRRGDTVWHIARELLSRAGRNPSATQIANLVRQIGRENGIDPNIIRPGQMLRIPVDQAGSSGDRSPRTQNSRDASANPRERHSFEQQADGTVHYVVRPGDTPQSISQLSLMQERVFNRDGSIRASNRRIPEPTPQEVRVRENEIRRWNNLDSNAPLQPGTRLVVRRVGS